MELTIELRAWTGKREELNQTLLGILPIIRKKKGCRSCRVYRDMEDKNIIFLAINWDEIIALEKFIQSEYGSAILGAIDLLGERVKIRLGNGSAWEGIEVLKRMRAKA